VALPAIICGGLALRLFGIRNGLPYLYNVDEPDFVSISVHMLRTEHLNPHWWGHPGSTYLYMLEVLYGAIYVIGHVFHVYASPSQYQLRYFSDPTVFYLSGRILSTLFAAASIGLVYAIGARLFSRSAALFAAAIVAVAPYHVEVSRLVRTDILATFFVLCAFWFLTEAIRKSDSGRDYALSGIFAGLATATKYPAFVFLAVIAVAVVTLPSTARTRWKRLALAVLGYAIGFVGGSPLLLPNVRTVIKDLTFENRTNDLEASGGGFFNHLVSYVLQALPETIGWLGLILFIAGIVACARSPRREVRLLPIFPGLLIVFLSAPHLYRERWVIPALPFCALCAAYGLETAARRLSSVRGISFSRATFASIAVVTVAGLGWTDIVSAREASIDTRTQAANWIAAHVPEHTRLLEEIDGPQLPRERFRYYIVSQSTKAIASAPPSELHFQLYRPDADWQSADIGELADASQIGANAIAYVVTSKYGVYARHARDYPDILAGYARVSALGERVFTASPQTGERSGPEIAIYHITKSDTKR
jgi:4-amino-4-deoxy-L-arabinose transferase-like glycosyltransferase